MVDGATVQRSRGVWGVDRWGWSPVGGSGGIMGSVGEQLLASPGRRVEQLGEVEGRHVLAGGRLEG